MKLTYAEWLLRNTPLFGGDDDPEDDPTDDPSRKKKGGAKPEDDPQDDPADDPQDDPEDDPEDDDKIEMSAKEVKELKDENARMRREEAKRQKKEKDDRRKKAEEEGKHADLAREAQEERDAEIAKREAAELQLDAREREIRTRDAATNLNFRDPADAIRFLDDEATESDSSVAKALKKLAEDKPYLLNDRPRTGKAGSGGGRGGSDGLTLEEIKGMSREEVAARMPEVHKALKAQQPASVRNN